MFGIDVGTTKVVALSGRVDLRRDSVEVVSYGEAPSRGLKRGVIVDRKLAADSVSRAIEASGERFLSAVVGIAGGHVSSRNIEVTLLNRGRSPEVGSRLLKRLEAEAASTEPGGGDRVLQVVPRTYVLDETDGVRNPLGLAARKVTMRAHVVSGSVSSIQNLLRAVEDCGVRATDIVLEPIASAESCLTGRDRERGTVLLDIGGGTTDLAVFVDNALVHTAVIPIGGESLTADVAYGLKVPFEDAERLKIRYGTVISRAVDSVAAVRLGDRHYNASFVAQILEYRAREILEYARDSLTEARVYDRIAGDVILTGGGSRLDGMIELTEEMLGLRARAVSPTLHRTKSKPLQQPEYSTAVGLLYFAARNNNRIAKGKGASVLSFGSIAELVRGWFRSGEVNPPR
ncbi:cell division protein FtsA [Rubrobacter indicoceani]|uniref:cell division protein FtsA n=1 Tax=Rubrobacter indicoceani TaxID=2051957 RepID=UPI0013C4B6C5|nr:cell division protein FtsA [Rubrobacter indicoceani]